MITPNENAPSTVTAALSANETTNPFERNERFVPEFRRFLDTKQEQRDNASIESKQDSLEVAQELMSRGWVVTPVAYGGKNAILKDWSNLLLSVDDLEDHFGGPARNVGVILGRSSGDLVDVDLDCPEALAIASRFLPVTNAVFGRQSKQRSHFLYYSDAGGKQFRDVRRKSGSDPAPDNTTMLVEIRSTGQQTVFPRGPHPSGEAIEWSERGNPSGVDAEELEHSVAKVAAASLLARHWPKGARHYASKALAGTLLRAAWSEDDTKQFIEAVCQGAHDEEVRARLTNVETTARRLEEGTAATGLPKLSEYFDEKVIEQVTGWLNLRCSSEGSVSNSRLGISINRQNRESFTLTSLEDLLNEPGPETSYVWDQTLPVGGFSICAAKPKVGKSTFARSSPMRLVWVQTFWAEIQYNKGYRTLLCSRRKTLRDCSSF